jgi:hypothetical protein
MPPVTAMPCPPRAAFCLPLLAALSAAPGLAAAADQSFSSEAAFLLATGATSFESFESLAGAARSLAPIVAPLLTVTPIDAPVGVQTGPASPENGFGAVATEGSHYLSVYLPNLPQGSLRITLAAPATAFGFNISDLGETAGTLTLQTNAGGFAGGLTLASYPALLGNGNVQFFGIQQDTPFTEILLTASGVDDAFGLDKLYVSAVPEPAHAALLLAGLGLLAGLRGRAAAGR